ncbi:globin domain-containing protein [Actinoplanes palleronii]|uniref:Oxidoreductase n=1 Tax=Actinoplanes palleronii TaxID=113570 RepID=A0ABQ4BIH5_9ACTN|nr:hypothetical protein [Actinoplanes palleronii]GIE70486.1 oxidoreductase [Actinoplanes palleronii]
MARPTLYDAAGGAPAMLALAADFHARCLADPLLEHPFSHTGNPEHVQRLADYWGEVLGGPSVFSAHAGGHSAMLRVHAHQGGDHALSTRFAEVFDEAVVATLPADPALRAALHDYMLTAVAEVDTYMPPSAVVPENAPMPHWSWR